MKYFRIGNRCYQVSDPSVVFNQLADDFHRNVFCPVYRFIYGRANCQTYMPAKGQIQPIQYSNLKYETKNIEEQSLTVDIDTLSRFKTKLKNYIKHNEIEKLFQVLENQIIQNSQHCNCIILVQSKYNRNCKNKITGIIDHNKHELELNVINDSILKIIDDLKVTDLKKSF